MSEVLVNIVLDSSSSMSTVQDATISGFNEYLDTLRRDKENTYKVSLTLFNSSVEEGYTAKPLEDVKPLTRETYSPNGMTALYDAACKTIQKVRHGMCDNCKGKMKNIVVILTDGQENSSTQFTQREFRNIVEMLQKENNWTFVFLGANQDSWAVAQHFGFQQANVANYAQNDLGVKSAFSSVARGTILTASMQSMNNMNFFDVADKQEATAKDTTVGKRKEGEILSKVW